MKKYIVILAVAALLLAGNWYRENSGTTETVSVSDSEGVTAEVVRERSITCTKCRGEKVCSHCDGECYRDGRRCRECGGTGLCDACNGAGSLTVREIDGRDYIICTACHGSGQCGLCDGTGSYSASFSTLGSIKRDCMLCHGTGECLSCHGQGVVELRGF